MPAWGTILDELRLPENLNPSGQPSFDKVRRKYLTALASRTQRAVIVYSSGFLDKDNAPAGILQITLGDVQGFMNAISGIQEKQLDLLITSPGGSPDATESIVSYLRTQFDHIRAFVPVAAMSAATMLALGCDEVVMGAHSQLGPIDPQFTVTTPNGPRSAPGQAILDQFEQAKRECQNPQNLAAWMPILSAYLPGLLALCRDQRELAQRRVSEWLEAYMLRGDPEASTKANRAAEWFARYEEFKSHGRRVSLEDLQNLGLKATALEDDSELQDAILSVHHCFSMTHSNTPAAKIIENHHGRAYVKLVGDIILQQGPPPAGAPTTPRPPGSTPPMNRAARRQRR